MAESRREEEEPGERRHVRRGQTTDQPGRRSKPEHLHSCQGPLSSIRAAIKRTKANSQSDNTRDRRRPEITIVSAEPLQPPTYDQVIKEKTEERHIVRPTAAPRRTACTTSGTQTEPVTEDAAAAVPQCTAPTPATEKTTAGKKPQKPPRPSVPKHPDRKKATDSVGKVSADSTGRPNTENESDSECNVNEIVKEGSKHTCTRSVTVHWDTPTDSLLFTVASADESTASALNSERSPHPVPRPRIKPQKQIIKEEAKVLVKLSGNCDDIAPDAQEVSSNKYLEELLEAFGAQTGCKESSDIIDPQAEDAVGEMSNNQSHRNIQARIQAFESQADEEHVYEVIKPQPRPRMAANKPTVAAKPSVALKPQFTQSEDDINHNNQNIPNTDAPQNPTPAPRPQPPKKPGGFSIKEELESLHSKGAIPNGSRHPVLTRANTIDEDDAQPLQPFQLLPVKEPLRPNLNINNHNSAAAFRGNEFVDSPPNQASFQSQRSEESQEAPFSRGSITKRPTTIRVPSRTGSISSNFLDNPPPLPTQRPVGSLANHRQSLSFQDTSSSFGTTPSLPPRRHTVKKPPPVRPPPAKAGPGRPPAPNMQAIGRSQSAPWETSPAPQVQRSHMKGPVLPPRPNPGHRLYNKYTLQLPHGIASFDYNGSNAGELSFQKNNVLLLLDETDHDHFECQVGETRGRVHKSRMKVITPLDMSPPQGAAASSGGGLKVEALHDFFPEGPGELALRAGDVVTMVEQVDNEWYKGTCRGSAGFFPINYVKVLSNTPRALPERKPRPMPAPVSGPRCTARFDFEGEHSDELSFSEGDVIQLKEYMGEDWARGQIGSVIGIFPLNFVEIIEDLPPPPSQQQQQQQQQPNRIALPGMVGAAPSTHPAVARPAQEPESSVEWAVAQYDYAGKSDGDLSFRQGDCILVTQHINAEWSRGRLNGREGMFPSNFVKTNSDQELSNNQQNGATGGGRARALYNYTSECDEELTLRVGDIVTNLESADDEWYMGDLKGKRALVPKNYVQMLV